jgi:hypothetical protein
MTSFAISIVCPCRLPGAAGYLSAPLGEKFTHATLHSDGTWHRQRLGIRQEFDATWLVTLGLSEFPMSKKRAWAKLTARACRTLLTLCFGVSCRASFPYSPHCFVRATPQSSHQAFPGALRVLGLQCHFSSNRRVRPSTRAFTSRADGALGLEPATRRSNRVQDAS